MNDFKRMISTGDFCDILSIYRASQKSREFKCLIVECLYHVLLKIKVFNLRVTHKGLLEAIIEAHRLLTISNECLLATIEPTYHSCDIIQVKYSN